MGQVTSAAAIPEAGIKSSVDSVGDAYKNALAETVNGLYKAEVIHCRSMAPHGRRRTGYAGAGGLVQPSTLDLVARLPDTAQTEADYYQPKGAPREAA